MEPLLVQFGQEEDQRLAATMPPREITLCEDETFHSQRDAKAWQQCTGTKLAALPVTVCQTTGDAAKARRVLGRMQATVAFFWTMIAAWLTAWGYDPTVQQRMRHELIPGFYLHRVRTVLQQALTRCKTQHDRKTPRRRSPTPDVTPPMELSRYPGA